MSLFTSSLNLFVNPSKGTRRFLGGTPGFFNISVSVVNLSMILDWRNPYDKGKPASHCAFSFAKVDVSLALHTCRKYSIQCLGSGLIGAGGISWGSISSNRIKDNGLIHSIPEKYSLAQIFSILSTASLFCYTRKQNI